MYLVGRPIRTLELRYWSIVAECASPSAQNFQWATLDYGCVVDVITDVASASSHIGVRRINWNVVVITIPILMLWNVRISWKKKLALMSIFSLTIIVIIFSIVRVALVSAKGSTADISWLYTWSNIEVAVCTFFFISVTSFFSALTNHWAFHSYCGLLPCFLPPAFHRIEAIWSHPKRQLPTTLGQRSSVSP